MFHFHESFHSKISLHKCQNDRHNDQILILLHERIHLRSMNHFKTFIFLYHEVHHFSIHHCIHTLETDHDKFLIHWLHCSVSHLNKHNHYYNNIFLPHVQSLRQKFPYNMIHPQKRIIPYHEIYYSATLHDNTHWVILFVHMFNYINHVDMFIDEIYIFKVAESFYELLEPKLVKLTFLLRWDFDELDKIIHCFCIICQYNSFADPFFYFYFRIKLIKTFLSLGRVNLNLILT